MQVKRRLRSVALAHFNITTRVCYSVTDSDDCVYRFHCMYISLQGYHR